MAKLSFMVGHTQKAPGAILVSPFDTTEYEFNRDLAQILASNLMSEHEVRIFFRDMLSITAAYDVVDEWKPDLSMELHTNSAEDKTAYGTETLCTERSKSFAGIIQQAMCQALRRDGHSLRQ
jgi:N-acetylmuramoyl-L-alanine amidase